MALTRERMMDRMLASDASYNGRFFTGVLTTGIYCLPSCSARKPKPQNVRFFATTAEARGAGLRPCKVCRPDEFERGEDPDLESIERLVESVRCHPGRYSGIEALADELSTSVSTLHQLFRRHLQASPGSFLNGARIEAARRKLLADDLDAGEVGFEVGFDSLSGFYESFGKLTGMAPAAYRSLKQKSGFALSLPDGYAVSELLKVLGRDPESVSERLDRNTYRAALTMAGKPGVLEMRIERGEAHCSVSGGGEGAAIDAHRAASRLFNLEQDPSGFEKTAREAGFGALISGREGLRISQTTTPWEGLVWVIVGQQVNLKFAGTMKRRLTELAGARVGDLYALPLPEAVAQLEPADLLKLQFSRQKADYLCGAARLVAGGELDLDTLQVAAPKRLEKALLDVRGLGSWSAQYLMMRSFGLPDCVPVGDTGLTSGLQRLYGLDHRPDATATQDLMRPFAPYRSLATYHLWRSGA